MAPKKAPEPEPEPEAEEAPPEPEEGDGTFYFGDGSKYGEQHPQPSRAWCARPPAVPPTRLLPSTEGHWMIKDGVKMRHGKGMFVEGVEEGSTPQSYEGEWSEDAMNGYGIFRYATNAKYEVRQDQASSPHDWPASAVGRQRAHGMCKPCPHRALLPHHLAGRVRQQPVFGAWHVHLPRRLDVRRCVQGGPDAWRRLLHRQAGTRHTAWTHPPTPRAWAARSLALALRIQLPTLRHRRSCRAAQGVSWKGKFYNGMGPGLPTDATFLAA